ncbi:MAG: nucleotidyl transferase AbiEii/AbiGii toxin family protein [Gammaproteobacteria bacterium]
MDKRLELMLQRYRTDTRQDYINALKEIMQEIALLALWRSKFFLKATFYGGTALRILYQLERFSEDLDFSLLTATPDFNLESYNSAIQIELESFGISAEVDTKTKTKISQIKSAFIKSGTKKQLIMIKAPDIVTSAMHENELIKIKIKMEIDVDPPGGFETEAKTLLQPMPFSVLTMQLPDLFAGKLHAVIGRQWKTRVKGRDWYDLVWFIARETSVRVEHLKQRLIQSQHWSADKPFTRKELLDLLNERIKQVDFKAAQQEVLPFIKDQASIALWSDQFFSDLIQRIEVI